MGKHKISVIIPVYKVENYIEKCIDSVINQSYKNLEIILVNDGSPDNCANICNNYKLKDSRVKVIHKNNEGLGYARNTGLEVMTGDYVIFIDSDDYVDIKMVETLYNKLIDDQLDTVFCGLNKVFNDGKIIKVEPYYKGVNFYDEEVVERVLLEMIGSKAEVREDSLLYMSVWHAIYSTKIIHENNIKFPSEREFMSEDISFHIDYLRYAKRVSYINNCLYYYRENNTSLSRSYIPNRFERQKKLYYQIDDKLKVFLLEESYQERLQRYFLGNVRGRIIDIVFNEKENKLYNIKFVINDDLVKTTLATYPYKKNPIRHRIFNFLIKNQHSRILWMITFVQISLKRKKYA